MIISRESLSAWGSTAFNELFKAEVEQWSADELPLQKGLSLSSCVSAEPFKVMVIGGSETIGEITVKAGIFYTGIIAGCSCSDDPAPTDVQAEYCNVVFYINRESGEASVSLLPD